MAQLQVDLFSKRLWLYGVAGTNGRPQKHNALHGFQRSWTLDGAIHNRCGAHIHGVGMPLCIYEALCLSNPNQDLLSKTFTCVKFRKYNLWPDLRKMGLHIYERVVFMVQCCLSVCSQRPSPHGQAESASPWTTAGGERPP